MVTTVFKTYFLPNKGRRVTQFRWCISWAKMNLFVRNIIPIPETYQNVQNNSTTTIHHDNQLTTAIISSHVWEFETVLHHPSVYLVLQLHTRYYLIQLQWASIERVFLIAKQYTITLLEHHQFFFKSREYGFYSPSEKILQEWHFT